jgi:dihydroxyacetone kinase
MKTARKSEVAVITGGGAGMGCTCSGIRGKEFAEVKITDF